MRSFSFFLALGQMKNLFFVFVSSAHHVGLCSSLNAISMCSFACYSPTYMAVQQSKTNSNPVSRAARSPFR